MEQSHDSLEMLHSSSIVIMLKYNIELKLVSILRQYIANCPFGTDHIPF